MRRRVRTLLVTTSCAVGCLITSQSSFQPLPPVTTPIIVDEPGVTSPRLANLVVVERGDQTTLVSFRVPVDDDGLDDPLQFQFFVNTDRDCLPRDGGNNCEPTLRLGERAPTGARRRFVQQDITLPNLGCNRVELWVSSHFLPEGDRHTPQRAGDVDFATWWIFKPATGAATVDPIESCAARVQP